MVITATAARATPVRQALTELLLRPALTAPTPIPTPPQRQDPRTTAHPAPRDRMVAMVRV